MRFVLAACYPPYSPSLHEFCPVVELVHRMFHSVREHGQIECRALQLVYKTARESTVCKERIVNVSEVKMARQYLKLVMTKQKVVHFGQCVDNSETFLPCYCSSLLRAFELAWKIRKRLLILLFHWNIHLLLVYLCHQASIEATRGIRQDTVTLVWVWERQRH
jgi:hypothetical protein